LIKTKKFSNAVLLQTVKSSWYIFISSCALSTALVFSFFLSCLYFLSLLFISSCYLSGMCSPKRQDRFLVSPRYLFSVYREVFPVGEASGTMNWPLILTRTEVKNERSEYSTPFYLHDGHVANLTVLFLGAFAKLRKTTISFVMSVRLSVRPHGTTQPPLAGFSWNLIFENFRKSVEKIKVSLKWTRINGTWRPIHKFYHISIIYS
jgi:hypothetical protein